MYVHGKLFHMTVPWTLLFHVKERDAQFSRQSLALFLQPFQKAHQYYQLRLPTPHKNKFLPAKASTRSNFDIHNFLKHHPTLHFPPKKPERFIILTMILNSIINNSSQTELSGLKHCCALITFQMSGFSCLVGC